MHRATYWPLQLGNSWDSLALDYDTTRLWLRKPWYSLEYQDVIKRDSLIPFASVQTDKYNTLHMTGQKQYEITDHLGNVLATISDFRRPELDTSGTHIGFYKAAIQSANDYYPFGMDMPGRNTVDTTTHFTNISGTVVVPVHHGVNRPWYGSSYLALVDIGFPVLSGTTSATIITANPSDGIYNVIYPIVPGYQHTLTVNVGSGGSTVTLPTAFSAEIWQGTSHIGTSVSSLGSGANILTFTPIGTTPVKLRIVNTSMASHAIAIGSITVDSITFVNQYVVSQIASDDGYNYGFNGQMKTNEWAGKGNHNTAKWWEYDARTGRRGNLDPKPTRWASSYSVFWNNPVRFSDPFGDTIKIQYQGGFLGLGRMRELIYENGKLYNLNGTNYAGKVNGFLKSSVTALGTLSSKSNGQQLVNYSAIPQEKRLMD